MSRIYSYKIVLVAVFSFIIGCMITINLASIERTCKLDKTDREYNIMNNSKLKSPDLIILILSAPKNLLKRDAVRETWLKLLRDGNDNFNGQSFKAKHYFVIGSVGLTPDEVLHISTEQSQHNDILILPIADSYKNLTLKVLKSFLYLSEQVDYGLDFKYVLKCDDDTFVRLDHLSRELGIIDSQYAKIHLLKHPPSSSFIQHNIQANDVNTTSKLSVYWGYFHGNANIKLKGKWMEKNYILCDKYITYALGGGYILSKDLVIYLGKNSDHLRIYNSEDVSVGTWLAPINNIIRLHDIRFDTEWATRGCQDNYLITHSVPAKLMYVMHKTLIKSNNLCQKEDVQRKFWLYDWSVQPSKCCERSNEI